MDLHDRRENNGHDHGKHGVNVGQADVRDEPQGHGCDDQGSAGEKKEKDKDPLFRLVVGLSFFRLFDPIG